MYYSGIYSHHLSLCYPHNTNNKLFHDNISPTQTNYHFIYVVLACYKHLL